MASSFSTVHSLLPILVLLPTLVFTVVVRPKTGAAAAAAVALPTAAHEGSGKMVILGNLTCRDAPLVGTPIELRNHFIDQFSTNNGSHPPSPITTTRSVRRGGFAAQLNGVQREEFLDGLFLFFRHNCTRRNIRPDCYIETRYNVQPNRTQQETGEVNLGTIQVLDLGPVDDKPTCPIDKKKTLLPTDSTVVNSAAVTLGAIVCLFLTRIIIIIVISSV